MNREYELYLQSPAWREKRIQRLKIAKNRCAACAKGKAIHVHHLTYARIFNEEMADLLPLCEPHHVIAEELIKQGTLTRNGDVLFLAVETIRLILTFKPAPTKIEKKPKPKIRSLNWKKNDWKTIPLPTFAMRARNDAQECLLTNAGFVVILLCATSREIFKHDLITFLRQLPGPDNFGRYMGNGCALYDRSKRKHHRIPLAAA